MSPLVRLIEAYLAPEGDLALQGRYYQDLSPAGGHPGHLVVLCSGYDENEKARGLISLGATGLLSKPYRIGELSEHLARFGG